MSIGQLGIKQTSTLTQNVTGLVGPVTPRVYWSCKFFTGPIKKIEHHK